MRWSKEEVQLKTGSSRKRVIPAALLFLGFLCFGLHPAAPGSPTLPEGSRPGEGNPFLVVLGIAQDGGFPQAGCQKSCCTLAWTKPGMRRKVSSLGIVDPETSQFWMIDATPDFREQLHFLDQTLPSPASPIPDGIFLTHGHIGHYTGLMHLGREAIGAREVPVHTMPRMVEFLRSNGPWDQLVRLGNISLKLLEAGRKVRLNGRISLTPFLVPHREEYTETVGYRVQGPGQSALFLPDINGWDGLEVSIEDLISTVDVAFLDGTFFSAEELPGRDLSEVPHPFITDTMKRVEKLSGSEKSKIHFIHLNHSNPALIPGSKTLRVIEGRGFHVAAEGERFPL